MATRTDYLKLHFIVFLWGFTAILGKLISIPTVEMIFYRAILAALGLGVVILVRKDSFKISIPDAAKLLGIGAIVAVHWLAFFGAARVSNVAVSLIGFATNSLWAAVLEPWMNRTRIKKFEVLLGLVVLVGLYVITSINFEYKLGLSLGILAGFTSALFSVFNSRMVRRIPSFTISFYEMIGIFVSLALFMPGYALTWAPNHELHLLPSATDWVYIAILAIACSVYAYSVAVELMKKISVFVIQLALNLEPVYGIIMALILFPAEEKMGANFYIGAAIILAAVASYPMMKRRFDRATTPGTAH